MKGELTLVSFKHGEAKDKDMEMYDNGHNAADSSGGDAIKSSKPLLDESEDKCSQKIARDYPQYNISRILKTLAAYVAFFGGVSKSV